MRGQAGQRRIGGQPRAHIVQPRPCRFGGFALQCFEFGHRAGKIVGGKALLRARQHGRRSTSLDVADAANGNQRRQAIGDRAPPAFRCGGGIAPRDLRRDLVEARAKVRARRDAARGTGLERREERQDRRIIGGDAARGRQCRRIRAAARQRLAQLANRQHDAVAAPLFAALAHGSR